MPLLLTRTGTRVPALGRRFLRREANHPMDADLGHAWPFDGFSPHRYDGVPTGKRRIEANDPPRSSVIEQHPASSCHELVNVPEICHLLFNIQAGRPSATFRRGRSAMTGRLATSSNDFSRLQVSLLEQRARYSSSGAVITATIAR